ncbi:MAG: acetyltransferase [Anaerolineae bacterium]
MSVPLVLIGASGHGRVAIDIARAMGLEIAGLIDRAREPGEVVDGVPVLCREPEECDILRAGTDWFVAVGDNEVREALFGRILAIAGRPAVSLVHPSAVISPRAELGEGCFVAPLAAVNAGAVLGKGVILNTAASVDHECRIEDFAQICPGCRLAGNVTVGLRAFLGTGAVAIPGVLIGEDSVVGAGSIVHRDLPAGVRAVGTSARVVVSRIGGLARDI